MKCTTPKMDTQIDWPWFIHDQQWSLLDQMPDEETRRYLNPQAMRPGNQLSDAVMSEFANRWNSVDRHGVALNQTVDRRRLDFDRIVITSDAGVGKSQTLGWLEYRINQSDSSCMAFRFDLRKAVGDYKLQALEAESQLLKAMAKIWHNRTKQPGKPELPASQAYLYLQGMARQGRLCLIFDGLDQASGKDIDRLAELLQCTRFAKCRIILAGRPHALLNHWSALFSPATSSKPWRFLKVEEFSRAQQVRYLGWLADGKLRFTEIPRESHSILTVPRVLSYLRREQDMSKFRHAADVYFNAVKSILIEGMSRSRVAAKIGLSSSDELIRQSDGRFFIDGDQVATALRLLAITAYYSLIHHHLQPPTWPHAPSEPDVAGDNFAYPYVHNVVKKGRFQEVRIAIKDRCDTCKLDGSFKSNWNGIAALNSQFLEQGLFENSTGSLDQIVWANRSLHEFLLAYFYSQLATSEECARLWDWIYLKDQSATEDYYQFWQFLCEMPEEARHEDKWLTAIQLLYQPAVGRDSPSADSEPKFYAKRSCEMIYRSWWRLDEYCQEGNAQAIKIRERWWGEFERIWKQNAYGPQHQRTAQEIVDHLLPLPGGPFRMGTTPEKQGIQAFPEARMILEQQFARFRENPKVNVPAWFNQFRQSKSLTSFREKYERRWMRLARSRNTEAAFVEFTNDRFPANERETECTIDEFQIGRTTLTNRFVRLFDPGHGLRESDLWPKYGDYSATEQHPAVYLSWFDGWVICQWLR